MSRDSEVREAIDQHPDAPTIEQWYEAFASVSGEEAATPEGRADIYRRFRAALLIAWTRTPPAILDRSSEAAPTPHDNNCPPFMCEHTASEAAPVVELSVDALAEAIEAVVNADGARVWIDYSGTRGRRARSIPTERRKFARAILARLTQTRTPGAKLP